jgi:hypothetical protein
VRSGVDVLADILRYGVWLVTVCGFGCCSCVLKQSVPGVTRAAPSSCKVISLSSTIATRVSGYGMASSKQLAHTAGQIALVLGGT